MRVVVLNMYFGGRPSYFDLFLRSCAMNRAVDFLFFVDFDVPWPVPGNVRLVQSTLAELRDRFQSSMERESSLKAPYKMCDFRPA